MKPSSRAAAAGILVAVGALVLWGILGRGANIVFADVLQQIREVHTVGYKKVITGSLMGEATSTTTSEVLVADRYRSRSSLPGGAIMIADLTPGNERILTLYPQRKRAHVMHMTGRSKPEEPNLLDRLLKIDDNQARPIGRKEIAGRMAEGFRIDTDAQDRTFWIDPQTRLPVWVEFATKPGSLPSVIAVMTDFKWNIPVDESLVSMTPPAGYESIGTSLDISTPTERDLLAGLKASAEFSQDRFPDEFSMKWMRGIAKSLEAKKDTATQAEAVKISQTLMPAMRGVLFAGNPGNGEDWHYAGKGVPLGQAGTPILWYKPKDSPTYRIIYADLTVAEVQPADVPTVASVTMQPFPTPPAESKSQGPAAQQAE